MSFANTMSTEHRAQSTEHRAQSTEHRAQSTEHRANNFVEIYKKCNNGTNKEKYSLIKSGKLSLPRYMDIELTNLCNFNCCFCPTGTKSMHRTKGFMQDDVVDALVENVKIFDIPGVRFIRWGEPTLHKKYLEIMKKFKDIGSFVHINTNGSLLDVEQIEKLIEMEIDSIKFSFQGVDEKTYNEMREGGNFVQLMNIIKKMHEIRGIKKVPYISISTTLTTETNEQVENFKRNIENYCDYYNIGYTKLNHLDVNNMKVNEKEKNKIRELQENERIKHIYHKVCPEAFDKLSVNWNGDVTLCCGDYDNFMIVGNILDNNIQQIFTSKIANFYRNIIAEKQYKRIKCCSSCYETVPLQK